MSNIVLDKQETTTPLDETSHDNQHVAHIVLEGFGSEDGSKFVSAKEVGLPGGSVVESMVFKTEITALCGMKLVAQSNPENRPLCQACVSVAKQMGWTIPGS